MLFGSATAGSARADKEGRREAEERAEASEERLTHGPWLVGDTISAADIAAFPLIMFMQRAAGNEIARTSIFLHAARGAPAQARRMGSSAWRPCPAYERTYPPHWKRPARLGTSISRISGAPNESEFACVPE